MGAAERKLVNEHVEAILEVAASDKMPEDVLGRHLMEAAIGLWRRSRSPADIVSELQFMIDNMDEDTEYPFMRP